MRAVIEVNGVSKLQPQPDWTQSRFRARARIKYSVNSGGTDAQNVAHDAAIRKQAGAKPEIDESTLQCHEWTKMTVRWTEHRPKQTIGDAD